MGLEEKRDDIEYPIVDDIDINGWDLRKALRLFWKSNPAFVEWIQSPIVYRSDERFADMVRGLLPRVYSCERGIHHYRSMARTNYRGYLRADLVPLKKYFYVLRPLLAVRWLETYRSPAPIEFRKLMLVIADRPRLIEAIEALLQLKSASPELGLSPQIPEIHLFIEQELERLEVAAPASGERDNVLECLSELFRGTLEKAWGRA